MITEVNVSPEEMEVIIVFVLLDILDLHVSVSMTDFILRS